MLDSRKLVSEILLQQCSKVECKLLQERKMCLFPKIKAKLTLLVQIHAFIRKNSQSTEMHVSGGPAPKHTYWWSPGSPSRTPCVRRRARDTILQACLSWVFRLVWMLPLYMVFCALYELAVSSLSIPPQ